MNCFVKNVENAISRNIIVVTIIVLSVIRKLEVESSMDKKEVEKLEKHNRHQKISGVYILFDSADNAIYVGQSRDIKSRLRGHKAKPWVYYKYITANNSKTLGQLESTLIKQYKPVYNKIDTKIIIPKHPGRTNRKDRLIAEKKLSEKYSFIYDKLSSRQIQCLLYGEFKMVVSHATVNSDMKRA